MPGGAATTLVFLLLVNRKQATEEALGLSSLLVSLVTLGRIVPLDVHVQHRDRCLVASEE